MILQNSHQRTNQPTRYSRVRYFMLLLVLARGITPLAHSVERQTHNPATRVRIPGSMGPVTQTTHKVYSSCFWSLVFQDYLIDNAQLPSELRQKRLNQLLEDESSYGEGECSRVKHKMLLLVLARRFTPMAYSVEHLPRNPATRKQIPGSAGPI